MDKQKDSAQLVREIYLRWLCTDAIERQPPTQSGLARLLGIQLATLLQWKHSPGFGTEIVKRLRMRYSDRVPRLIDSLSRRAGTGDIRAMNLLLSFVEFNPRLKADTCSDTTDEEFARLVENAGKILEVPTWLEEQMREREEEEEEKITSLLFFGCE